MRSELISVNAWCAGVAGRGLLLALVVAAGSSSALAGGPRFVTGTTSGGAQPGVAMAFYTSSPAYYTDPGDLNAAVSHAQADAMVAAAAATWNVPTSSLVLAQGGALGEHVSGANTYFDGTEMVFPADVEASNWQNIPIAVIYDTDGSVIDTLLGEGASDPSGCRQTGVVESVDGFGSNGTIEHAMLILNGRCVGSAPEQLLQMQYDVERAFGRVLGLAWSQLNDNIFTGTTPPSAGEIQYWPVMHPIDVLCGAYSYQCITNPSQLRPDDLSVLAMLYPVTTSNLGEGKAVSTQNAVSLTGTVLFPTGQGMEDVNVTVTRQLRSHAKTEPWQVASGVTGVLFQENGGNPVSGGESNSENVGKNYGPVEGQATIRRVPDSVVENLFMETEAIDPLYTGEDAIAPYQRPPLTPSGSSQSMTDWSAGAGTGAGYTATAANAATTCSPGADGTRAQPAASNATGWWTGLLCAMGHSSWWSVAARAGRSWTVEVTALDESGAATLNKAQPVIGVWNAGDPGLPTVASAPAAMNAWALGVTQVQVPASGSAETYTFAVADQFGAGRPDFGYQARVLYADSVIPAVVGSAGGVITIAGEGFRQGNSVMVNGVAATVVSWTATQIVARAPSMDAAGTSLGDSVDVTVMDPVTGGVTTISGGLSYNTIAPDVLALVSAPTSLETGLTATTPFAVRVFAADGVTPLANATVQFSVSAGSALLAGCAGGRTCALQTDATGVAQTKVSGGAAGGVTLAATEVSGGATVQVTIADTDPVRGITITTAPGYVAAGTSSAWTVSLTATQDGAAAAGVPIVWSAGSGLSFGSGDTATDASGAASVTVQAGPFSAGSKAVTACAWTSVCASWTVYAVDASQWNVVIASGAGQSVAGSTAFAPVMLEVTDGAGHPLQGAAVTVYQTVDAWEGVCPSQGRCAASPVLASAQSTAVSDANGLLTVTLLQVPGQPQTVNIVAVTGTQGFVSFSLVRTP
jgi:hypothetical protein